MTIEIQVMRHKANIIRDQVLRRGVTLKQGEDGEGAKRQNQVGGLMKCHAPIIS